MSPEHMGLTSLDIERTFTYHAPKGDQPARYVELQSRARQMALAIIEWCPESREKSIALTKLEEVSMWANKSIAVNE
jgi:hypothetical protein